MGASNSPYSTAIASSGIDYDFESSLNPSEQMRKYKTEEEEAKAPNTLPFEFGELPQNLATIVDNAFAASTKIDNILKIEEFKEESELLKLKANLEKIIMYLMSKGDKTLSKYTMGNE